MGKFPTFAFFFALFDFFEDYSGVIAISGPLVGGLNKGAEAPKIQLNRGFLPESRTNQ